MQSLCRENIAMIMQFLSLGPRMRLARTCTHCYYAADTPMAWLHLREAEPLEFPVKRSVLAWAGFRSLSAQVSVQRAHAYKYGLHLENRNQAYRKLVLAGDRRVFPYKIAVMVLLAAFLYTLLETFVQDNREHSLQRDLAFFRGEVTRLIREKTYR